MRPSSRAFALAVFAISIALIAPRAWAQQAAPVVPNPGARDMFQLKRSRELPAVLERQEFRDRRP